MKLTTEDINFELNVEQIENDDKEFIREVLMMIDRKSTTAAAKRLKNNMTDIVRGYQALAVDKVRIHNGTDKLMIASVERTLKDEKAMKKMDRI